MTLTITKSNNKTEFVTDSSITKFVTYSTKMILNSSILEIVSDIKKNFAHLTIRFNDYDSITVSGVAATSATDLQNKLNSI